MRVQRTFGKRLTGFDVFAILHQRYPYELAESSPECRDILEAIYNSFVGLFENAILTGQKDGSIAPDLSAQRSALIVFAMADSMVRFRMNNLYDVRALSGELVNACRRMLEKRTD